MEGRLVRSFSSMNPIGAAASRSKIPIYLKEHLMKEFMLDINYINSHDSDSTFHRSILNFSSDMSIMLKYIDRNKTWHNFASSNHPIPSTQSLLFLGRQVLAMFRAYRVKASEVNLFSVELLLVEWIRRPLAKGGARLEASLAGASDPSFFAWLNPAAVWMFCPHLQGTCCCSGVSQLRTKGWREVFFGVPFAWQVLESCGATAEKLRNTWL